MSAHLCKQNYRPWKSFKTDHSDQFFDFFVFFFFSVFLPPPLFVISLLKHLPVICLSIKKYGVSTDLINQLATPDLRRRILSVFFLQDKYQQKQLLRVHNIGDVIVFPTNHNSWIIARSDVTNLLTNQSQWNIEFVMSSYFRPIRL